MLLEFFNFLFITGKGITCVVVCAFVNYEKAFTRNVTFYLATEMQWDATHAYMDTFTRRSHWHGMK